MQFKLKATNSAEETQLYWKTEFFCEKRCNLFGKFFAREQNEINHEWKRGEIWKAPALENKRLFCLAGHYFSKEKAEKEMWRQKKPRCVKRIQKRKKEKSECKEINLYFFFHPHWRQQSKKERKNERKGSSSGSNRLTSFWSSSSYTSCLSDIDDFIIIISLFPALPHKEIFQLGIQGLIATPSLWAGFKNRHFCPRNILIKPSIAPGSATRIFCST